MEQVIVPRIFKPLDPYGSEDQAYNSGEIASGRSLPLGWLLSNNLHKFRLFAN